MALALGWGILVLHVEFVNVISSGPLAGTSTYKAMTGEELKSIHLRPFGSECSYVPDKSELNAKWDTRGKPALFMGYDLCPGGRWSGGYRVAPMDYFLTRDQPFRLIVTKDIKFPAVVNYPLRRLYEVATANAALTASPYGDEEALACLLYTSPSPRDS